MIDYSEHSPQNTNTKLAQEHSHDDDSDHGHSHGGDENKSKFRTYLPAAFSFTMLVIGIALDSFGFPGL